ncbi:putative cyclohexanonemonooxygenase [Diaporthe ampelina]|uniref:Putative cyclohexanonemonooxygenase n=1 Tax=Diaporthe ampelina TaxID=1214573 RepID=A0A0G2HM90_9PEZI|nr:putative cyclohexanonemonooxygenase [Diaporthe ampelina]
MEAPKYLIYGGGHSGILCAYRLIESGLSSKDIVIANIAGAFGAGGVFSIPKIPKISKLTGWSNFRTKKHAFHTYRCDYAYTGSSQAKPDITHSRIYMQRRAAY